jgi:CBS domain containing-hemolysin-like protein
VMTPRPVMFTLPEDRTVREVLSELQEIRFSRIPITGRDPDDICSFVLKSDILLNASLGDLDTTLRDLGRKILVVPETATLVGLFEQVLDRREHIALVVDEYGGVSGLVTMEDIVETLLGLEIVDETDSIVDMQELARRKWAERARAMGLITDKAIKGRRKDPGKNPQGS